MPAPLRRNRCRRRAIAVLGALALVACAGPPEDPAPGATPGAPLAAQSPPPGPVPANGCRATATLLEIGPLPDESPWPPFLADVPRDRLVRARVRLGEVEPLSDGLENLCVRNEVIELTAADAPPVEPGAKLRLELELLGDTDARHWRVRSIRVVEEPEPQSAFQDGRSNDEAHPGRHAPGRRGPHRAPGPVAPRRGVR